MKVLVMSQPAPGQWQMRMGADSAVLRHGEPVFLPESGRTARVAVVPALRIGRLGFCVRSNYGSYINGITLFQFLAPDPDDLPPWLPPFVADRSFSPGQWLPMPDDDSIRCQVNISPLPGRTGNPEKINFSTSLSALEPERHIREISRFCTLKTGDVLLFLDHGTPMLPAGIDSELTASLNGTNVLNIRLK